MAYKIEDIDWKQMPKGAVEFSLEDDEYLLTWYDVDGNSWYCPELGWCAEYEYENRRELYIVRDHHPSVTTNRKPTREELLDKALRELMRKHFSGSGFEWNWREGKTLEIIDQALHKEIVDLLK